MTTEHTPTTGASTGAHAGEYDTAPTVRNFEINGVPCVAVSLCGVHGVGKEMLLNASDWARASKITPFWSVAHMSGLDYIYSGTAKAAEIARRGSKSNMLFLARWLAKPKPGQFVRFINRNHLDLTRANLRVLTKSAHSRENVRVLHANTRRREAALRSEMMAANAAEVAEAAA